MEYRDPLNTYIYPHGKEEMDFFNRANYLLKMRQEEINEWKHQKSSDPSGDNFMLEKMNQSLPVVDEKVESGFSSQSTLNYNLKKMRLESKLEPSDHMMTLPKIDWDASTYIPPLPDPSGPPTREEMGTLRSHLNLKNSHGKNVNSAAQLTSAVTDVMEDMPYNFSDKLG